MLESLLNYFFGCAHRKTSFPLTCGGSGSSAMKKRATYVTCLECGIELAYDWDKMRVGAPIHSSRVREARWTEWTFEQDTLHR